MMEFVFREPCIPVRQEADDQEEDEPEEDPEHGAEAGAGPLPPEPDTEP